MGDYEETHATVPAKPVFFFDIDNCLYPKDLKVHELMADLIDTYFMKHLDLPWDDAVKLHQEYYRDYGLAIEGLVRFHKIDALEYNSEVDDALPLEEILKPDPVVQKLLEDIDRSKVRLWLFTNAYVNHGKRVVRLLEIDDKFEGITFCNYGVVPLVCKPQTEIFVRAMQEAGVKKTEDCFFVDDSYNNCKKATELGWTAVHLVEEGQASPATMASRYQIKHLDQLRSVFPQFFKNGEEGGKDAGGL